MSDGRVYTNYKNDCEMNAFIQNKYAPGSNEHQFRYALQRNADQIMKDLAAFDGTGCKSCPVCSQALSYKPTGDAKAQFGLQPNPNSLTN